MTNFMSTAVDRIATTHPNAKVCADVDRTASAISRGGCPRLTRHPVLRRDSAEQYQVVHSSHLKACSGRASLPQVAVVQFSNDVRVELPLERLDRDAFHTLMASMVCALQPSLAHCTVTPCRRVAHVNTCSRLQKDWQRHTPHTHWAALFCTCT